MSIDHYKSALFGVAIGDAVGVPYEFKSRAEIARDPARDMVGYGTHGQVAGTWSDDASLTFCLADALTEGFDLQRIARNFIDWRYQDLWTARGEVFDIGITTQRAIDRLVKGTRPDIAGDFEESSNGNGALMRILPLLFYIKNMPIAERFELTRKVSAMTHGHIRSVIACFYYLELARNVLPGGSVDEIYKQTNADVITYLDTTAINRDEVALFDRILSGDIADLPVDKIHSSGYVLHTLEASIWCLLSTDNYKDSVLSAVNLGSDTDTTAAVTGGLAGLYYGYESIPEDWRIKIARHQDIADLSERLKEKLN